MRLGCTLITCTLYLLIRNHLYSGSVFLAHQFELLKPQLESLIPENKRNFLTQFYSQVSQSHTCCHGNTCPTKQTVSQCHDLKKPVYSTLGAKGIPFDQVLVTVLV